MLIDLPNQSVSVEDFQDFVADRMNEPTMGITEVFCSITPATQLQRKDKIMNIKLGR